MTSLEIFAALLLAHAIMFCGLCWLERRRGLDEADPELATGEYLDALASALGLARLKPLDRPWYMWRVARLESDAALRARCLQALSGCDTGDAWR